MFSILVKKIIITDGNSFNDLLEDKGKVYTFLNPVSYLTALENKELFASFDGICRWFHLSGCHKIIIWNNSEKAKL